MPGNRVGSPHVVTNCCTKRSASVIGLPPSPAHYPTGRLRARNRRTLSSEVTPPRWGPSEHSRPSEGFGDSITLAVRRCTQGSGDFARAVHCTAMIEKHDGEARVDAERLDEMISRL